VDLGGGRRLWRQEAGSIILQKKTRERFSLREASEVDLHKTAWPYITICVFLSGDSIRKAKISNQILLSVYRGQSLLSVMSSYRV